MYDVVQAADQSISNTLHQFEVLEYKLFETVCQVQSR